MSEKRTYEKKASNKTNAKKVIFAALALILEAVILFNLIGRLNSRFEWTDTIYHAISLVLVLIIYAKHKTSSMKMPWIIMILIFPVAGVLLYCLVGLAGSTKKMSRRFEKVDSDLFPLLTDSKDAQDKLSGEFPQVASITNYITKNSKYPLYNNSTVEYFDDASKGLASQLKDLEQAEKFIFMEYHAIEDSVSWKQIEDVLERKVSQGVEVRLFYDEIGSAFFINSEFAKRLMGKGINVRVFNPVGVVFNLFLNNRDHRKITVIDGKVAYTGGYNLADEYFNVTHPYGQWKDTGIRVTNEAVNSFTMMFLEMWNAAMKDDADDKDYSKYIINYEKKESDCYLQPYADSPMDDEHVGEEIYISIINASVKYCYLITPYLIITDEMIHALCLAAKRGVDVRIVTPGIPDKKAIYSVTRSFYNGLVRNGVRIYEWTPGFCHCKMSVSDDLVGTVGTINLDYRSLYHHFENGCLICNSSVIPSIREDLEKTFAESREVTEKYRTGRSAMLRAEQMFLRLFAELL